MQIILLRSYASIALVSAITAFAEPTASLPSVEIDYFRNSHGAGDWGGKTFNQIVPLDEVVRIVPLELHAQEELVGTYRTDIHDMITRIYNPFFEFLARSNFRAEPAHATKNDFPFETFILLTSKREAFKCWIEGPGGSGVGHSAITDVLLASHGNMVRIPIRGFSAAEAISRVDANRGVLPRIEVEAFGATISEPRSNLGRHFSEMLVPQTIKRILLAQARDRRDGIDLPRFSPPAEPAALPSFDAIFRDLLAANPASRSPFLADYEDPTLLLIAITEDNDLVRIGAITTDGSVVSRLVIDARDRHGQFRVAGASDQRHN